MLAMVNFQLDFYKARRLCLPVALATAADDNHNFEMDLTKRREKKESKFRMQYASTLHILHIATEARFAKRQSIKWEDSAADTQQRGNPPFLLLSPGSRRTASDRSENSWLQRNQQRPALGRFWLATTRHL